jgi:hypothetical protein
MVIKPRRKTQPEANTIDKIHISHASISLIRVNMENQTGTKKAYDYLIQVATARNGISTQNKTKCGRSHSFNYPEPELQRTFRASKALKSMSFLSKGIPCK